MSIRNKILLSVLLVLILVSGCTNKPKTTSTDTDRQDVMQKNTSSIDLETTKDRYRGTRFEVNIASWNLNHFDKDKASDKVLLQSYTNTMKDYDLIFLQGIQDSTGNYFDRLCKMMENYSCTLGSISGDDREQYAVIYKPNFEILEWNDLNIDDNTAKNRWERPPLNVIFNMTNGETLSVWSISTKPEDTELELLYLDEKIGTPKRQTVIIGDMNADCSYYKDIGVYFREWHWLIQTGDDTTVGRDDCAYERIILNDEAFSNMITYGILTDVTKAQSDDYLVWVKLKAPEWVRQ